MRTRRRESGSAAVEFALVLPLLLVVALGLVQIGLIARDQLLVVQASRAGAREAAVSSDGSAVRSATGEAAAGLDPSRLQVSPSWGGGRGEPVTVSVAYEDPIRVPFVGWLFPQAVTLRASATMRQEFS